MGTECLDRHLGPFIGVRWFGAGIFLCFAYAIVIPRYLRSSQGVLAICCVPPKKKAILTCLTCLYGFLDV